MIRLPAAGESFGRYQLERTLGHGGMGVVLAARDTTLGRDVAVKLVVPQYAADPGFRARFQQEAATLAKLDSAHVVSIFDHGEQDGVLFLVTQLVAGGDLLQLIHREGAMPPALAIDVLGQVVLGLCDAHAVGVIHRDIKPANVLLRGRGRDLDVFLCDFGIATTPGADLSRTGTVAGSLPYMAPERHRGEKAGVAGDVYAAGCLLWHVLTGSAPYAGTDVEVALGHIQGPIPQLPGKDDFSSAVNALLRRSMAKEPRRRHPSARALHAELAHLATLAPDSVLLPGATAFRAPIVLERGRRRWVPGTVAAVATGAVVVGTLFAAGFLEGDPERQAASVLGRSSTPSTVAAAKVVNEPPTLVPATSSESASSSEPTDAAEPGEGPRVRRRAARSGGDGGAGEGGGGDGGPVPTKRKDRTKTSTTPTPAPVNHYRCWNGDEVPDYSDCTRPLGWTGASYIFRDLPNLSDCRAVAQPASPNMVESWGCRYASGGTEKNWVTISRWYTSRNARSYYSSWFSGVASSGAWLRGDRRFGVAMSGRKGDRQRRFGVVRIYENEPWSVSVNATDKAARKAFFDRFHRYRYPNWLRGYKYQ
ncbi:serine/threonine protein kinase [Nocardioides sp. JQ2195]|uniref:serine/threonine-protein kinase n=1 Tax=Nocardioides sp. JQ2195 TaxID=2592334 RepID=UPI00143EA96F|nr:serine/threonine-protein kinase [Nocardioides sp. JQ2195]QIX25333.1 serine/threonine protein kinase [Nocardioides sp. JQ2195]